MGQHNSHIYNDTDETIQVTLIGPSSGNSDGKTKQFIQSQKTQKIATGQGAIKVLLHQQDMKTLQFLDTYETEISSVSDKSFIVKCVQEVVTLPQSTTDGIIQDSRNTTIKRFKIVESKYNQVDQEDVLTK